MRMQHVCSKLTPSSLQSLSLRPVLVFSSIPALMKFTLPTITTAFGRAVVKVKFTERLVSTALVSNVHTITTRAEKR